MGDKTYQPHDKDFKFKYKRMGVKIHNYLFKTDYKTIDFLDTVEAETGKTKDIVYTLDGKDSFHEEHESTPITTDDIRRFHNYNKHIVCDKSNFIESVHSYSICTAKPGKNSVSLKVDDNYTFEMDVFYTKNIDGAKVLSTLKDKVKKQVELTDDDQAALLLLSDSDIDMPVKQLMIEIAYIIHNANISLEVYEDLIACYIRSFKRFFEGDELSEMLGLLQKETEDEKIAAIVEQYGLGFDEVYKDGIYDGKLEDARNLLAAGVSEDVIFQCIGISRNDLEKLKREL